MKEAHGIWYMVMCGRFFLNEVFLTRCKNFPFAIRANLNIAREQGLANHTHFARKALILSF